MAGIGDYNAYGVSDLLVQNAATGAAAIWAMNGANLTPTIANLAANLGIGWRSVI